MEKNNLTYRVSELPALLGIGRNAAYALTRKAGFPAFRVGKSIWFPQTRWIVGSTSRHGRSKMMIYKSLPLGAKNAIDAATLARLHSVSERTLRRMILSERLAGRLILSTDQGYFRPAAGETGETEIRAFCHAMAARSRTTSKIVGIARAEIRRREKAELDGQLQLEDE